MADGETRLKKSSGERVVFESMRFTGMIRLLTPELKAVYIALSPYECSYAELSRGMSSLPGPDRKPRPEYNEKKRSESFTRKAKTENAYSPGRAIQSNPSQARIKTDHADKRRVV
ncbi:hypothetical protein SADUNF_Sadunf08G0169500 [Salix dunnii]|uniref:Uncharacterized protein n=1 Tax=Salix dunnii TaxID=1413687 RepID=A0A835JV42_9ROSI|nr:hypothetical protein SADUNF_Sadunf08G0169500 [Salix dunnii]